MSSSTTTQNPRGKIGALLFRHEMILLLVLVAEWFYFNSVGRRFGSLDNTFDIMRHSAEIGLLALVMTPIILTGGIDLSVGSLLGLCAILFGKLWRDAGMALPLAAVCTLLIGALAGGLNALLIARLRLPALIVTLGTYSLFRGLAEAITRGVDTFTNFPDAFLTLGQKHTAGLPTQVWFFLVVAIAIWLLVHQTTFGRSLRAIGFAPEGARFAGLPVERRIAQAYVLAGVVAALAAIIYTARLGQAKADAGTGYELLAITAVVLGGTSIFGGTGAVWRTVVGVLVLGMLSNGFDLAGLATYWQNVVVGALIIGAIALQSAVRRQ